MNGLIETIAKERTVENLIRRLRVSQGESKYNLDDLAQDIYISLMEKPEDVLEGLYERRELEYYILRMIVNNICSKTSPYYTAYKKPLPLDAEFKDYEDFKIIPDNRTTNADS